MAESQSTSRRLGDRSTTIEPVSPGSRINRDWQLDDLLAAAQDAWIVIDPAGVVCAWNPAAERLFDRPACAAIGSRLADLILSRSLRGALNDHLRACLTRSSSNPVPAWPRFETTVTIAGSANLDVELTWTPMPVGGPVESILVLIRSIHQRQQIEARLKQAEAHYQQFVEQLPCVTYVAADHPQRTFINISPQIDALVGQPVGRTVMDQDRRLALVHPDDRARLSADWRRSVLSHAPFACDYRLQTVDGTQVWIHDMAVAVDDASGTTAYWQGVQVEITGLKERELSFAHQATHDTLTGLPNRAFFLEHLRAAIRALDGTSSATATLFLDLDSFKRINDSLGHEAGNQVLREVAERLRQVVRTGDVIGRLSGDEFTILAVHLPQGQAAEIAQQLADRASFALRRPFQVAGREVTVTASIGVAVTTSPGLSADDLVRQADLAMYRAKRAGKDRVMAFEGTLEQAALDRLDLEAELRLALDERAFVLEYQPLVSLATGEVIGLEALVRWRHADGHLIPPSEFVPLAEETGLIIPLGDWVLEHACWQLRTWGQEQPGWAFPVSINLSAVQFRSPALVERIGWLLASAEIPPGLLCLEMTESTMMDDIETTATTLRGLADLGIRVAIDDFGMGYSSLAHLKRFPLDVLKIDRGFVAALGEDLEGTVIVSGMIGLAHALGMTVVAEGVETPDQVTQLLQLGCDDGQGYLFAVPWPAEEVAARLARLGWSPPHQARAIVRGLGVKTAPGLAEPGDATYTGELQSRLNILDEQRQRLDSARQRLEQHLVSARKPITSNQG